mgnify:CR=1 FL=1|tara:strand:+ start:1480 stop:2226 length:747 start_codon:yes stop_codon:yes gene_type:complete
MSNAGVIIIGNEILSGRTLDQNSNFIAKRCSEIGISLEEVRIIPDLETNIIKSVKTLSKKYDNVFVTGGIGPTHDDITANSIAIAFKKKLILNKVAKKLLIEYYSHTNIKLNVSRMKMAYLPSRSTLILNPVSAAPGFKIKNVWVMAGVPKIMQAMFLTGVEPKLKKGKITKTESVKVDRAEGDIANILETINNEFKLVNIGSYPFFTPPKVGTNIVFRCTDIKILNKSVKKFCYILKSNGILFTLDK